MSSDSELTSNTAVRTGEAQAEPGALPPYRPPVLLRLRGQQAGAGTTQGPTEGVMTPGGTFVWDAPS